MGRRGDAADPISGAQVVVVTALPSMRSPALNGSTTKLAEAQPVLWITLGAAIGRPGPRVAITTPT
jgi:hypothetical protein